MRFTVLVNWIFFFFFAAFCYKACQLFRSIRFLGILDTDCVPSCESLPNPSKQLTPCDSTVRGCCRGKTTAEQWAIETPRQVSCSPQPEIFKDKNITQGIPVLFGQRMEMIERVPQRQCMSMRHNWPKDANCICLDLWKKNIRVSNPWSTGCRWPTNLSRLSRSRCQ